MPSPAYELGLSLDVCGILSIEDLLRHLRDDPRALAELLDSDMTKAAVAAAVVMADASVQTEPATATVATTMDSIVNVREVSSMASFSAVTGARMVSSEVQCNPSQPQMVQRAVQATPAPAAPRVAMQNVAVNTVSWQEIGNNAMDLAWTDARQEVLGEFEPALERAVVAAEVQATRAAAKLKAAGELKDSVRAGFENQARTAAAAAADRRAAAEDRIAAARDRAHNEGVVELLRARLKKVGDWSEA